MELNKLVCDAGILGAGGAGFPTHVKINCKAEFVLANAKYNMPIIDGLARVSKSCAHRACSNWVKSSIHYSW